MPHSEDDLVHAFDSQRKVYDEGGSLTVVELCSLFNVDVEKVSVKLTDHEVITKIRVDMIDAPVRIQLRHFGLHFASSDEFDDSTNFHPEMVLAYRMSIGERLMLHDQEDADIVRKFAATVRAPSRNPARRAMWTMFVNDFVSVAKPL